MAFLQKVKAERPELYESKSKINPIIPTVDGVVSYADVDGSKSYPVMIAEIFDYLNDANVDFSEIGKKEAFELVRNLILECLAGSIRCYQWDMKPQFPNVKNLASIRREDGIHVSDLHDSEIRELIANLIKQQTFEIDKYIKSYRKSKPEDDGVSI